MIDLKDIVKTEATVNISVDGNSDSALMMLNAFSSNERLSLENIGFSGEYLIVEGRHEQSHPRRLVSTFSLRRIEA